MKTKHRVLSLWLMHLALIVGAVAPVMAVDSSYVLRPGDAVLITVFEQDEFTTEAQLSKQGEIEVPLIGTVVVGGKSIKDAVADLTAKLSNGFVVDPKVTLTLTGGGVNQAIVIGMVNKPGFVDFPDERRLDVLSAIAMSGGFADSADLQNVTIRRDVNGKSSLIKVDPGVLTGEDASLLILERNDVVQVGQVFAKRVTVMGEVDRPGFVDVPGVGEFSLLSAIAMAGGYTEAADAANVVVRRGTAIHRVDAKALAYVAGKQPFTLQPQDVVIVGKAATYTVTLLGEVKLPGLVEIPADTGLTLLEAIALVGGYTDNANPRKIVIRRRATEQGGTDKFYRVDGKRLAEASEAQPISLQPNDLITVPERFF